MKAHTNAAGGAWGEDTWAALVKDNHEEAFDNTTDGDEGLEDTVAKRALLIPIEVFQSSQIIRIASLLGQSEDYKKFGADEETPSGVELIRNSTQMTGSSLNLHLSDVSSIMPVSQAEEEEENIVFEELQKPDEVDFLDDENESADIFDDESECQEEEIFPTMQPNVEEDEDEEDDEMNFTCMPRTVPKVTTMKSRTSRNLTVVEQNEETFYVCACGFSSRNKSGSTRHKCRSQQETVMFSCKDCGKMCKNPGSLKRHLISMHKNRQSMSLPLRAASKDTEHRCQFCAKVLANRRNLSNHIAKVHGPGVMDTLSTSATSSDRTATAIATSDSLSSQTSSELADLPARSASKNVDCDLGCTMCGKVLANKTNLRKHMAKVHGQTTSSDGRGTCESKDISLIILFI